ncbi:hypothetical protein EFK50_13185 [Nocardioides marmoriginsengisoli]|uniref:Uncharacterized protein n=1 Tax=Nocardioides marmoriginsengisoli TaxID=661483 RepID=A0A3N0CGX9_9ACTN|nr:hypothetical protein [Nocardioides marmoriginsengisoli]RNL62700.1 hypothetical protein EFK50_13185 [Nocardioides marmoriginsengisoli]
MADNTAHTVQHLEEHELFALLLVALKLHAGREAPVGADVTFETEAADLDRAQVTNIAHAHRRTCAEVAESSLESLASVMAALATHIAFADLLDDPELRRLYASVVSDSLAGRNQHFIEWDDDQTFPPALDQARNSGSQGPLLDWYEDHLEPQPAIQLFAVIIGAMTDGEEMKIKAVRSRATAVKLVLERHGYAVHAPCTGPPSGRDPAVVVQDDVDKIARADIVIALLDPAAHGVGILLGEAARSHPAVIFVAEACTDITPLAAIVGDPDPTRVTYITDASMATEVERALIRRRDALRARAARRRLKATNSMETYDEYSQAYRFALDSGLTLEVPDHPDYRVRLICTSMTSFRAATQTELEDICTALNDLLYGPDQFEKPAEAAQESEPGAEDTSIADKPSVDGKGDVVEDDQDDEFVEEWDQPSLFQDFTRHTEAATGELPPGWRKVNPLTERELNFAEISNEFLELNQREFRRMVHEARVVRYRESLAGAGVSRAHFGDARAWLTFWKVNLGRP